MSRSIIGRLGAVLVLVSGLVLAQAPTASSLVLPDLPVVVPGDVFTIAPTTLNFPDTAIGDTSAGLAVTITNASTSPQTLTSVAGGAPFDPTNFDGVQNCVGVTLAPGGSCAFTYTFHPTSTGTHTTITNFSINGQDSGPITLGGTGTPAFTIAPTTLNFPATAVGDTSAGLPVTITNASTSPQTLTSVAGGAPLDPTNFDGVQNCVGVTLAPGGSCAFTYTFHPATTGTHTTTTNFSINGQSSGTITLDGTANVFAIAPTTLNFDDTTVGDVAASIDVTVTNVSADPQTLTSVAGGAPLDPANFGGYQDCAGTTLAPGASCAFTYLFTPTASGPHTTTTNFSINGQDSGVITLNGTALDVLGVDPLTLDFPDTTVGSTSAPLTVTVTNESWLPQTLTVVGMAPADPTHFAGATSCDGLVLDPGESCTFSYSFAPTSAGPHTTIATLSITTDALLEFARVGRSVAVTLAQASVPQTAEITLNGTGILAVTPTPTTTPTTTATTTPTSTPTLAATGADVLAPLAVGGSALLAGTLLLLVSRRNRRGRLSPR